MSISEVAQKHLADVGWKVDRYVDISIFLDGLIQEGYEINDFAKEFLMRFGGLELKQPAYRVDKEMDKLHFNPLKTCEHIYREQVETYENRVNESLVVVGEAYNEHLVLMISATGKVYGAYDNYLTLLGNNYEEALDTLFLGRETIEIK